MICCKIKWCDGASSRRSGRRSLGVCGICARRARNVVYGFLRKREVMRVILPTLRGNGAFARN